MFSRPVAVVVSLLAVALAVFVQAPWVLRLESEEDAGKMSAKVLQALGSLEGKRAVVVGGTSGIGRGVAVNLARAECSVTIVGRSAKRGAEVVAQMQEAAPSSSNAVFSFVPCDCFSLKAVRDCAAAMQQGDAFDAPLDYLVLSQGMATLQGYTPTAEGHDQKLTLHVYSRAAFALSFLPSLRRSEDARVLSVLSAGVHSSYRNYSKDVSLSGGSYSIKNAADAAGFYNDIMVDALSEEEPRITFMHAAPGFVNTNWGTEMPAPVRWLVRCLQPLGRSAQRCGEYMVGGMMNPELRGGFHLLDQYGRPRPTVTPLHAEAKEQVWAHIKSAAGGEA